MPDKITKTIRIKWVRSGIGFPRRQKTWVQSLGLTELNQVVERPDTPQIRGLVARAHHLVEILGETAGRAALPMPEYTVLPPEAAPIQEAVRVETGAESAATAAEPAPSATTDQAPEQAREKAGEAPVAAAPDKSEQRTGKASQAKRAKQAKPAKGAAKEVRKPVKEGARKGSKAPKAGKK